jgi:ribosomal protein S6--L-glutamate ligase
MQNIIVVNGEHNWQEYFPGFEVQRVRLQESRWLFIENKLWVFTGQSTLRVDAVLWRLGAVRPEPEHRTVLELIRMSGVPCVNSVHTLLRCYDRLSMLNELREAKLPVISYAVALGDRVLERLRPQLPAVLKVGNYHGGFGKALASTEAQWIDLRDLTFTSKDYQTVEPFIEYQRDIRCLMIGDELWSMSRKSTSWRANSNTNHYQLIDTPKELEEHTRSAMKHLNADLLGLDFLEQRDGSFILLESNDTPGLSGFPDLSRSAVAARLREKMMAVTDCKEV